MSSLVVQLGKDLMLSLQWLGSLLWCRFNPWPKNFHMPQAWPKKKDTKEDSLIKQKLTDFKIKYMITTGETTAGRDKLGGWF